ncbi:hypothetical protein F4677DRAFT_232657 [Hypoxylon crocopeplum]|nr:hypothetical protein F4677DRAFT_232657 [Hypoxylon crocopeplum]
MDIASSPSKRRVLAPVDVNSRSPAAFSKLETGKKPMSPIARSPAKRPLDHEPVQHQQRPSAQPIKKQRVSAGEDFQPLAVDEELGAREDSRDGDCDAERQRSDSPDEESSIFDNSVIDTSQDTTITEPDAEVVARTPPAPPRRQLTREEARQKAETLRLRLGLASYKVRTGQTDVPLDQLKVKPLLLGGDSRYRQLELTLPPLARPIREVVEGVRDENGNEDEDEDEDRDSMQARLAIVARRALPTAPPPSRGDNLGLVRP